MQQRQDVDGNIWKCQPKTVSGGEETYCPMLRQGMKSLKSQITGSSKHFCKTLLNFCNAFMKIVIN